MPDREPPSVSELLRGIERIEGRMDALVTVDRYVAEQARQDDRITEAFRQIGRVEEAANQRVGRLEESKSWGARQALLTAAALLVAVLGPLILTLVTR